MIIDYIKRNKYLFTFLCVILLISFIYGIIIFNGLDNNIKINLINNLSNIKENMINSRINDFFMHIFIIFMLVLLSFSVLGYFFSVFYVFFAGMSISFSICTLTSIYGLKGLIFGILYNIMFKLVYLLLILMINSKIYGISKGILGNLLYKYSISIKKYLISIGILLIMVIINDVLIYYLSNFFIKILINML